MGGFGAFALGWTKAAGRDRQEQTAREEKRREALASTYARLAENAQDPEAQRFYQERWQYWTTLPIHQKPKKGMDSLDYIGGGASGGSGKQHPADTMTADDIRKAYDALEAAGGMELASQAGMRARGEAPPSLSSGLNLRGAMDDVEGQQGGEQGGEQPGGQPAPSPSRFSILAGLQQGMPAAAPVAGAATGSAPPPPVDAHGRGIETPALSPVAMNPEAAAAAGSGPLMGTLRRQMDTALAGSQAIREARDKDIASLTSMPQPVGGMEGEGAGEGAGTGTGAGEYDAFGRLTAEGKYAQQRRQVVAQLESDRELAKLIAQLPPEEQRALSMLKAYDSPYAGMGAGQRPFKGQLRPVLIQTAEGPRAVEAEYDFNTHQYAFQGQPVQPIAFGNPIRTRDGDEMVFSTPDGRQVARVSADQFRQTSRVVQRIDQATGLLYEEVVPVNYGSMPGGGYEAPPPVSPVPLGGPAAPLTPPSLTPPSPVTVAGGQPPVPGSPGPPIVAGPGKGTPAPLHAPVGDRRSSGPTPTWWLKPTPVAWWNDPKWKKHTQTATTKELRSVNQAVANRSGGLPASRLLGGDLSGRLLNADAAIAKLDSIPESARDYASIAQTREMMIAHYRKLVTSAALPVGEIPAGALPFVMADLAARNLIPVNEDTKNKLIQFSDAEAALQSLESELKNLVNASTPEERMKALLQYESMAASMTRLVGRSIGEKGVFTNQDSADMRALMAVGMIGAGAIAFNVPVLRDLFISLAEDRITRTKRIFATVQENRFKGLYNVYRKQIAAAALELGAELASAEGVPPAAPFGRSSSPAAGPVPAAPSLASPVYDYKTVATSTGQSVQMRRHKTTGVREVSTDGGTTWQAVQ